MGIFSSKQWDEMLQVTKKIEDETNTDRLNNSDIAVMPLPMDPRSPTLEITRTPIQIENSKAEGKGKFTFSTEFDPRSPTIEINRTPFLMKLAKEANKCTDEDLLPETLILTEQSPDNCRLRARKLCNEDDESLTETEDSSLNTSKLETQRLEPEHPIETEEKQQVQN